MAALLLLAGAAALAAAPPDSSPRVFETAVPVRAARDVRRASFVRVRGPGADCDVPVSGPAAIPSVRYKTRLLCNSAALQGDDLAMAIARFRELVDADVWGRRKQIAARVLKALAAATAVWGIGVALAAARMRRRAASGSGAA